MSRRKRWNKAAHQAREIIDRILAEREMLISDVKTELDSLVEEYEEWYDNMPENLQSSTVGEKLSAIIDLDLDQLDFDVSDLESILEEIEGADLPLGFGRDG